MDPVVFGTVRALIPVLVSLVVLGAPAVILYILRDFRLREKQLQFAHDQRLARVEQERDLLQMQIAQATSELEFTRNLLIGVAPQLVLQQPARIRLGSLPAAPSAQESGEVADEADERDVRRQR